MPGGSGTSGCFERLLTGLRACTRCLGPHGHSRPHAPSPRCGSGKTSGLRAPPTPASEEKQLASSRGCGTSPRKHGAPPSAPPGVGTRAASPAPPTRQCLPSSPPAWLDTATRTGRRTRHGKTAECPKNKYVEVSPSQQRFQLNQDLRRANRSGHVGRPGRFRRLRHSWVGPPPGPWPPSLPLPTTGHTGGGVSTKGSSQPGAQAARKRCPRPESPQHANRPLFLRASSAARSSVHTRRLTAPLKCASVSQAAQVLCLTRSALGDKGPEQRALCSRHQAARSAAPRRHHRLERT